MVLTYKIHEFCYTDIFIQMLYEYQLWINTLQIIKSVYKHDYYTWIVF